MLSGALNLIKYSGILYSARPVWAVDLILSDFQASF